MHILLKVIDYREAVGTSVYLVPQNTGGEKTERITEKNLKECDLLWQYREINLSHVKILTVTMRST